MGPNVLLALDLSVAHLNGPMVPPTGLRPFCDPLAHMDDDL
jgi:hypothetical protein